jgi:hypothetical protein
MWIMTNYGILMPSALEAKHCPPGYTWDMQVRARDISALRKAARRMRAMDFEISPVMRTPGMDYEARFYCHADDFGMLMHCEIAEIDYVKFKPATMRKGGGGIDLHNLYNHIWYVVAKFYDSEILGGDGPTKKGRRK